MVCRGPASTDHPGKLWPNGQPNTPPAGNWAAIEISQRRHDRTPEAREILRALGADLTDEAAARQLGTSLRTYRRRVAELMAALEADFAPRPGPGPPSSA